MPVQFNDTLGKNVLYLTPHATLEEAVVLILEAIGGKNLYLEFLHFENTFAGLQAFLQTLYDNDRKELAEKGALYYDLLQAAVWKRQLHLYNGQVNVIFLKNWMDKNIYKKSKQSKADSNNELFTEKIITAQKLMQQDKAILNAIVELGHDPLNLPINPSGGSGVKAKVRSLLDGRGLFNGPTVFKHAWDRLRHVKKIKDQKV